MRKVLIISPHFPPVNAPDMQRVRIALPHFRALGWEPVVLAVTPDSVEGAVLDPLLETTYPSDIRIIRVQGIRPKTTRRFGVGSLWWRCAKAIRCAGGKLLGEEKFDLVFFSTTQFDSFTLGPLWKRRFGVPYVLDYQDPWVNDYYSKTGTSPPGGLLKFGVHQWLAKMREPGCLREAAAVVTVSSAYAPEIRSRHPEIEAERFHHIPFGTALEDFKTAHGHKPPTPLVPANDGFLHQVYTGRCGPDMSLALRILFRAYRKYSFSHPEAASRIRFHFIGTDYAPPPLGRFWALPIAKSEGVEGVVSEHCYRVPYFDVLHYLTHADALLAVGSKDPTYSASKIFPYLFSGRPLLTLVHKDSLMLRLVKDQGIATSYGFDLGSESEIERLASRIHHEWFVQGGDKQVPNLDSGKLSNHTGEGMTRQLCGVFERCVAG